MILVMIMLQDMSNSSSGASSGGKGTMHEYKQPRAIFKTGNGESEKGMRNGEWGIFKSGNL